MTVCVTADRFPAMAKRVGVLTSGGDAPGMNAAIRTIAKAAASLGVHVLGVENGYTGLLEGRFRPLTVASGGTIVSEAGVDEIGSLGGTVLGSARGPPP